MQWKKELYSLVKKEVIKEKDYENLILLPSIRDKVFFPDYFKDNYLTIEPNVVELETIVTINFHLISLEANRLLYLNYNFVKSLSLTLNGGFNDMILNLSESGTNNKIDMEILVNQKSKDPINNSYNRIETYSGNFTTKTFSCFNAIKLNYDKYASDIISGLNWEDNAWKSVRD